MSLFVDLRQIKSSVTNLSDMVDRISTNVGKEKQDHEHKSRESVLFGTSIYKPSSLGFGVRFSQSQEDVFQNMPSSRLRSHMSLPNLGKADAPLHKSTATRDDNRPRIEEIDDYKNCHTSKTVIQISEDHLNDLITASLYRRPHFDDNDETHPMDFLENVQYYISELNMPEEKKLPFIISCLDGVPLMWARCFRSEFKDAENFYSAFEHEFWGADRQKSVLYDLKLGKYNENSRMSMSEYFLHKVSSYRHLTPAPSDLEIVYSLAAHFPSAVELELRLSPKPTLREAYRVLRRREGEAADFLPNYLYEMCEAFQRGQRPESARRPDGPSSSASYTAEKQHSDQHKLALHESEGNWTETDCVEARRSGALWGGQARACRRQPSAMPHVAAAARMARAACLSAHAGDRWNCSSVELAPKFSPDLLTGTREQAYVYAMSAAALTWSVARACAAGSLAACSCASPPRAPPRPPRQAQVTPAEPHARFKWGGCSDNYQWAERFAKQFLDAHEIDVRDGKIEMFYEVETTTTEQPTTTTTSEQTTSPPVVILVDDQPAPPPTNATEAPKPKRKGRKGRKRLPRSPRRGRPTRKRFRDRYRYDYEDRESRYRNIEYRMAADDPRFDPQVDLHIRLERLRPLIASANLMNSRFGRKVVSAGMRTKCTCHGVSGSCSVRTCWRALPPMARVAAALASEASRAGPLRERRQARRAKPRLRYVTPSPDYCEPDPAAGSLGTHGRKCNASAGSGAGGCGRLCCGRGRRLVRSSKLERCHCRYHWCCRVDCQLCRLTTEEHYCN